MSDNVINKINIGGSTYDIIGVPDGGTAGQVLTKNSETDYDVSWEDAEGGGITPITYSELVILKNQSELVPGMQYRITDYTCTTTQTNTQSASNVFDIIVTADSESELNENARAAHHTGDTYFANCDLDSWELKYCLENDTSRFAWADSTNGKGVIYYMKDEWNNIAPFDFKNIQFIRDTTWFNEHQDWATSILGSVPSTSIGFYFLSWVTQNNTIQDLSIVGQTLTDDEGAYNGVYNNEIKGTTAYNMGITENATSATFALPCTILVSSYACVGGAFYGCRGNSFGSDCYGNTLGNGSQYNTFENHCYNNTFDDDCCYNSFGNYCYSNSFMSGCSYNSFWNGCYSNSFGESCYGNTFGNSCYGNMIGDNCSHNTFGNRCYYNILGSCYGNTFGNSCYSNIFGNNCTNITVFDNVQYCNVPGGTNSLPIKNVQILNGTQGASAQNKLTISFEPNKDYTQVAGLVNGTDLRIWIAENTVTGPSTSTNNNIALFDGTTGKIIKDSGVSVSDLSPDLCTSTTYSALKTLKDGGNLIPGMQYRITDYTCTTTQANTQSASHVFDIIVTADDTSILNENARACHHTGDTYFANCNLKAWELKYCLENDTNRFGWADSTNGKGVIYYMKDEFDNECPYDFKNIMFKRWEITECDKCESLVVNNSNNPNGLFYGSKNILDDSNITQNAVYGTNFDWFYTFSLKDLSTGIWYDYSSIPCTNEYIYCGQNKISSLIINQEAPLRKLNNIVFFNCISNLIDENPSNHSGCALNNFHDNCHSSTLGNNCEGNTIGVDSNITAGDAFISNILGCYCSNNIFGNTVQCNIFGNYCINNSFVNTVYGNHFGNYFMNNSIDSDFETNEIQNYCLNNNFGGVVYSNTFGQDFSNNNSEGQLCFNYFGNTFKDNTLKYWCYNNEFLNACNNNTFGKYFHNNTVHNNVRYCVVGDGTSSLHAQNAQILSGIYGTSSDKIIINFELGKHYTQIAGKNSSGVLKIWNPADLIQ